jgi:quercetin dioxygenase-like cupin family protein
LVKIEGINELTWHNTPCPQYIIMLQGAMEIEVGDGTKRIFKEGNILLAEDTSQQLRELFNDELLIRGPKKK